MVREHKKKSFSWFKISMYLLVAAGLVIIGRQEYAIYKLNQERDKVQARLDVLQEKQKALEDERERLHDPRYVEKLAREEYNMVGKNEVPLFVVEKEQPQKTNQANKENKKP